MKRPVGVTPFEKGIGDVKLHELTTGKVERFCDDLKDAGVGLITIRRILEALKGVLRYAVSRDLGRLLNFWPADSRLRI
jgi:hypothetical protein